MNRIYKIVGVGILASLLVLIRASENSLFYDPLLEFFKADYKTLPLPIMDVFSLQASVALRFFLNTFISFAILWLVFRDKEIIKLSAILYVILFAVFFFAFSLVICSSEGTGGHMILFYVRRFLIQPLFLLILIPAFYFQKYKSR